MTEASTDTLADAPAPAPRGAISRVERRRLRRLILGSVGLLGLLAAWECLTWVVAYTDDAYVRSDLVAVAPQVAGVIVAVHVADNQAVRRGDALADIDKVPFQLAVEELQAAVREANADAAADRDAVAAAQARLDAAAASLRYADDEQHRVASLISDDIVSRKQFDHANEVLRSAEAEQAEARAAVDKASESLVKHEAAITRARASLALAQWRLGQTELRAPVDGTINNLTVRAGDTAHVGAALIGIVDAGAWRIVANYKQGYITRMHPGDTAWVWLGTHPWRFYRARIQGIARGISREPTPDGLLPYVAPTTDWIRLRRRFPVTLTLVDPPADLTLYMGADASALIFR